MNLKRGITLFCFILLFIGASAQDARIEHYSVNEGLSQTTVTSIFQDSRGYMWIGTGYGLNRFDGHRFVIYKTDPYDPHSISDNSIRGILEDTARKEMWIGTDNGLNRFDCTTGKFKNILAGDARFTGRSATPEWTDSAHVWFYQPMKGLFTYHFSSGKIEQRVSLPIVSWIFRGRQPYELWFQDSAGTVHLYNCMSCALKFFSLTDEHKKYTAQRIIAAENNEAYIANDIGLLKLDIASGRLTDLSNDVRLHIGNKSVKNFWRDEKGNYWVSIWNEGLFVFDSSWRLLRSYTDESIGAGSRGFSFKQLNQLYVDRSGNMWIGTNANGLAKMNSNVHFSTSLKGDFIKCFYMDDDKRLWVGTYTKGIYIIDRKKGTTIQLMPNEKNGMISASVSVIFEDKSKHLFVGTDEGLMILNRKTMTFNAIPHPTVLGSLIITAIHQTSDGQIWVGTQRGLYKAKSSNEKWTLELTELTKNSISSLYEDSKGNLLVSAADLGLFVMKPGSAPKLVFKFSDNKLFSGGMALRAFCEDSNKALWAASNIGLVLFDDDYKPVKVLGERNGLADNFIYGILKAPNGELWYSTNKGIGKYDPATGRCRNYSEADGLQSREFNTRAFYSSAEGEFFFGGVNGYNNFYPLSIKDNPVAPGIAFSEFSVFGDLFPAADSLAAAGSAITLPYNENTISFLLSALEYSDPQRNTYAYKLEGVDADYFMSGTKRFVRYSGLQPGTYRFIAKAANADGVWSEPKHLFTIVITPPFWQAGWFIFTMIIAAVLLVALAVSMIVRWRFRKRLAVLERQREIEKVRHRISKDIHDDIGAGLTRIALISEAARMELQKNKSIDERLITLSDSAREMSQSLREIVWSMNPGHDNMSSLLGYIRNYSLMFFDEADVAVQVDFPGDVPEAVLTPDFRRNLFMIVKEACNNIAKHAQASRTELSFIYEGNKFTLTVKDDGKGFLLESTNKFSNGLVNMKKRAQEIGCEISIESSEGKGTMISISGSMN